MASNLDADQDIIVGSGRLGTLTRFTSTANNMSIVPDVNVTGIMRYTSVYVIDIATTSTITLPSPSNVSIGWKCKIFVGILATIVSVQANIRDHLGNIIFSFYSIRAPRSNSERPMYSSATFILRDPTTWIVEADYPQINYQDYSLVFNSLGYPIFLRTSLIGTLIVNSSNGVQVNVPFITPTLLMFNVNIGGTSAVDPEFYTFNGGSPNITINKSGNYLVTYIPAIVNSGGATSNNLQFALLRNGIAVPFICNSTTFISSTGFILKSILQVTAGDVINIVGGKTIVSAGTSTIAAGSILNIKFLG
jgi:hypothetical protein